MLAELINTRRAATPAGPKLKFDCGCEFHEVNWQEIIDKGDCPAVWDMIGDGLTKGVFQLEGSLGRRFSKKIAPQNIDELSDVISLIRPGCLEAEYREDPETGKMLSITQTYIKVRDGELEPEYIDESLEPILKDTYGVPIYQEQVMRICQDFAGFDLTEADKTRKAVGKKIPELMAKVETMFVEGALKQGHDEGTARTIFSWIDKFSGYGFNKSHGVGYAAIGYMTAFAKVHFPIEFFKAMLSFSDSKQDEFDEKKQLVHEARLFGIEVMPPSVKRMNADFDLSENTLYYGLSHVKNVGASAVETLKKVSQQSSDHELLVELISGTPKVKKNVAEALIKVGAFDYIGVDRIKLLARYQFLSLLTKRELLEVTACFLTDAGEPAQIGNPDAWLDFLVSENIPRGTDKSGVPRALRIKNAWDLIKRDLGGNRKRMSLAYEKFLLGMPISGSETELYSNPKVDTNCRDFLRLRNNSKVSLGVIIEDVRKIKDKNKNEMCFLKISDSTYMLDGVVCFASVYGKVAWILEQGNAVLIKGKKRNESLLVDYVEHL